MFRRFKSSGNGGGLCGQALEDALRQEQLHTVKARRRQAQNDAWLGTIAVIAAAVGLLLTIPVAVVTTVAWLADPSLAPPVAITLGTLGGALGLAVRRPGSP